MKFTEQEYASCQEANRIRELEQQAEELQSEVATLTAQVASLTAVSETLTEQYLLVTGRSQVQALGERPPKTWDDYERGCLGTFRAGYHDEPELSAFQGGMRTVFNLLRAEFPLAETLKQQDEWTVEMERYQILEASIRDDELAAKIATQCNDPAHDPRWCNSCEHRSHGINSYQAELLRRLEAPM